MSKLFNYIHLSIKIITILLVFINPSVLFSQYISGFLISPSNPSEIDTITIIVNGEISNTAIGLVDSNIFVYDTLIQINLYFKSVAEIGAPVMLPYYCSFAPYFFNSGNYIVQCNSFLEGQHFDYADTSFTVHSSTGIKQNKPSIKEAQFLHLYQNYPNPFNNTTTIIYKLPQISYVTLKIFNNIGKKIEILINSQQEAGEYKIEWDGSNFPSGLYFYRLQSRWGVETRKLILLK